MGVVGVDVGQQRGHDGRHSRTQVLGRQTVEVADGKRVMQRQNQTSEPPSVTPTSWNAASPVTFTGTTRGGGLSSPDAPVFSLCRQQKREARGWLTVIVVRDTQLRETLTRALGSRWQENILRTTGSEVVGVSRAGPRASRHGPTVGNSLFYTRL